MKKLPTKVTRKKLDKDEMKILAGKVRKTLEEEDANIMKKTKVEKWEKDFDKQFPTLFDTDDSREGYAGLMNEDVKVFISCLLQKQRQEIIDAIEKEAIHISAGLSVKVDCNKNSLVIEKADLRKHLNEPISKHEVKSSFGRKLIKHLT
jgi:hypothetical protein